MVLGVRGFRGYHHGNEVLGVPDKLGYHAEFIPPKGLYKGDVTLPGFTKVNPYHKRNIEGHD